MAMDAVEMAMEYASDPSNCEGRLDASPWSWRVVEKVIHEETLSHNWHGWVAADIDWPRVCPDRAQFSSSTGHCQSELAGRAMQLVTSHHRHTCTPQKYRIRTFQSVQQ